jgi:hypothetical protein
VALNFFQLNFGLKFVIGIAATLILLWEWLLQRRGQGSSVNARATRGALLAVLGATAIFGWWNFGRANFSAGLIHYHEFFHYFLGSKYFPELEYTGLYDCVAAADVQAGYTDRVVTRWIRDLKTNELMGGPFRFAAANECRARFSPERWTLFMRDVDWFRRQFDRDKWAAIAGDHGYNATPVWNATGYLLSNMGPATDRRILLLALIDPLLLLIMWAVVWWAFGWPAAAVAAIWWGANYPARYTYIGGAFLRQDWMVLAVIGICLVRRGHTRSAGFALTWSTLLRIFPGFILLGLFGKIAADSIAARRIKISREHWRLAQGAVLALLILLPYSVMVGVRSRPDVSVWSAFAQNSRKHLQTPLTNNVGLPMLISFDPSSRAARISKFWVDAPFDAWMDAHNRAFADRRLIYVALVLIFVVALAIAARGRDDWTALVLGIGSIPVFTAVTCYYYGILLGFGFLALRDKLTGAALAALAAATIITPAIIQADDDRYMAVSAEILLFVFGVTLLYAFKRRQVTLMPETVPTSVRLTAERTA